MYDNERDKELLQAPYKKLARAEELVNSNALLDLYVSLYKKRYKAEPIFGVTNEHLNMIKTFAKSTGHRAYGLLEHFFEMKDPWYQQQAHSISCLLNNLNKVNASYSQANATQKLAGKINVHTFCDCCGIYFTNVVPANHNYDKPNRCENCIKSNAPLYRPTKAERMEAVSKISSAFPELTPEATEEKKQEQMKKLIDFEKKPL